MSLRLAILPLLASLALPVCAIEPDRPSLHVEANPSAAPPPGSPPPRRAVVYQTMQAAALAGVNPLAASTASAAADGKNAPPAPGASRVHLAFALPAAAALAVLGWRLILRRRAGARNA